MGTLKARVSGAWVDIAGTSDEVFVGPDDPIATIPTSELWYDTDASAIVPDDVRWYTGWGVVANAATGGPQTFTTIAIADITGLSATWTPVVGRKYLTTMNVLARKITAGGDISILLADGAGVMAIGSVMTLGNNGYGPTTLQAFDVPLTTAPITRKGQCHPGTASAVTHPVAGYGCSIVVEDVGPASGSFPAATPAGPWIPLGPLLINSWVNYGAPFGPAFYRKVGDEVSLRGLIQGGSPSTAIFCTLPVGYRPLYDSIFATSCQTGVAEVRVTTAGNASAPSAVPAGVGAPATWLSLNNIRFSVTA